MQKFLSSPLTARRLAAGCRGLGWSSEQVAACTRRRTSWSLDDLQMCHYRAHWRREKIYWAGERRRAAAGKRWMMIRQSFLPARYLSRWWCCCGCFSNKRVCECVWKSLHWREICTCGGVPSSRARCATRRALTHWNFAWREARQAFIDFLTRVYGCKWFRRILPLASFLLRTRIMKLLRSNLQ